jgi:ribosome-interacting GTPase 1
MSKYLLEYEMHNASVYASEEKLALTKVVKVLKEAYSTVFTICFTCKVDEKAV